MKDRPDYFYKELVQGDYVFYLNDQDKAYVPETKDEFELFLDAVFSFLPKPSKEQKRNYRLIKEFPFLLPKNRWDRSLNIIGEYPFDFTWTEISSLPKGWLIAFAKPLLKELKDAIMKYDEAFLYEYMITDIKEKYGGLRWYDNGATKEMYKIVDKYENMSYNKCIICGKDGKANSDKFLLEPLCPEHTEIDNVSEDVLKEYEEAYDKLGGN